MTIGLRYKAGWTAFLHDPARNEQFFSIGAVCASPELALRELLQYTAERIDDMIVGLEMKEDEAYIASMAARQM